MMNLKRWAWAAGVATAVSGPAFAQVVTGTGATGTGATTTGTGTTTTTTTGATTTGGTTTFGSSTTATNSGGIQLDTTTTSTPTITSTTSGGVTATNVLNSSNAFSGYYANPLYQGRAGASTTGLTSVIAPGGFGTALYTSGGVSGASGAGGTGGARTGTTGATAGRTGTTGTGLGGTSSGLGRTTTGGLGGATGRTAGGFGGTSSTQNTQNQQLSTGRQVSYTQTLKFPAPPPPPPAQLTADLQSVIASSASLGGSSGVQATAGDNGVVVLRGTVADADEARVMEGMVRLTPGVKAVQNELTIK